MIDAVSLALRDLLSPAFRGVLWKSLALTLGLLAALWIVLERLVTYAVTLPYPWLNTALSILAGLGLVVGLGFLLAPVTSLFAGLFLDSIADVVEQAHYPADPPGRAMPIGQSLAATLRFFGVVLLVNLLALPLVLLLGFGFLIFLVANAYLLGREYFELAALRFHGAEAAKALRLRHSGSVFLGGMAIAVFTAIPIVNLLAPLFATSLMVHLQKRISAADQR